MWVTALQTGGYHAEMPISARSPIISAIVMETRRNGPLDICPFFARSAWMTPAHRRR